MPEPEPAVVPPTRLEARALPVARMAARVSADLPLTILDAVVCAAAFVSVLVLRFDAAVPDKYWQAFVTFLPLAVAVHVATNWIWGLYGEMWRHASVNEARRVLMAGLTSALTLVLVDVVALHRVPLSVVILGSGATTMTVGFVRFQSRLFAFHRTGAVYGTGLRVLVVGAGEAGAAIVREMLRTPAAGLCPVAILDDDRRKQGRSLAGVPIVGGTDMLADAVVERGVNQVVLAVTNAERELVRRVASDAMKAGAVMKVLPSVRDLIGGQPSVRDVRDVRIEDLLGRDQVPIDLDAVRGVLAGRVVLITGAGGSIGSEIARQVAECEPARLLILDHDETHLHDAAATIGLPVVQLLVDIRDDVAVDRVFGTHRPDVVFHAAAHKHVPLLESHPSAAIQTNVIGTNNLVNASLRHGVERFVFISSDKAVQPVNVLGATKRLGEQIVMARRPEGGAYCSVRFGNVLGSRGSVIPTFTQQIAAGGPVTVTDPRMTRFFMSVKEAVQLVLQASAFAEGGDVFMLDMGEPVSILELAERMIRLTGLTPGIDIPIRVMGIRPGEKLSEELRAPGEDAIATPHPAIIRLFPDGLEPELLDAWIERMAEAANAHDATESSRLLMTVGCRPIASIGLPASEEVSGPIEIDRSVEWSRSTT